MDASMRVCYLIGACIALVSASYFILTLGGEVVSYAGALGAGCTSSAVMLTYTLGGRWSYGESWNFFQPFKGGYSFVALQIFSWSLLGCSLVSCYGVQTKGQGPGAWMAHLFEDVPIGAISASAGVTGFLSEICMISCLALYETPSVKGRAQIRLHEGVLSVPCYCMKSSAVVVYLNRLLTLGVALSMFFAERYAFRAVAKYTWNEHDVKVAALLAAMALLTGCFLTHGIAGRLHNTHMACERQDSVVTPTEGARAKKRRRWAFWQPFQGGTAFVTYQAIGWAASALSFLLLSLVGVGYINPKFVLVGSGALGFVGQVLLSWSIYVFKAEPAQSMFQTAVQVHEETWSVPKLIYRYMETFMLLGLLYFIPHFLLAVVSFMFAMFPARVAFTVLLTFLVPYMPSWLNNSALRDGSRSWPWIQSVLGPALDRSTKLWFNAQIRVSSMDKTLEDKQYIFGFHPHGLYPVTSVWCHYSSQWSLAVPNTTRPCTLGASVLFLCPLLRELVLWAGGRDVSAKTFELCMREGKSVIVCPGGQTEIILDNDDRITGNITLDIRRRGFLRKALDAGVPCIPMFCFGENRIMRNLVVGWRGIKLWTYKKMGFPSPWVPVGWAGLTLMPKRERMAVVMGAAVYPPSKPADPEEVERVVEAMHQEYYTNLRNAYEQFKGDHGYAKTELIYLTDHIQ